MGFPFLDVLGIIGKVVDKAIPDPAMKAKLQLDLATLADQENQRAHDEMMGQIGTNTAEASNSNMFVAGWRPFIGWTGGIGIAYSCVLEPMMNWVATVVFSYHGSFPTLETGQLYGLVTGMLGFGTMRAVEKIKGVTDSRPLGTPVSAVSSAAPSRQKILGVVPWPF